MIKYFFQYLIILFISFNILFGGRIVAQNKIPKFDIAFVLRGYDSSCYYCDSIQFDLKAQELIGYMNKMSFGKINTYRTFANGIDSRSPILLQSLRDINTLQAALNGWPGSQWDWLRNRTDFWLVVPSNYIPIVQNAISWMQANKLPFYSWGTSTPEGIANYQIIQSNIIRMGPSSATDYLDQLKMPNGYIPSDYKYTHIVFNSNNKLTISGGGASNRVMFLGVVDSLGKKYTDFEPRGAYVFYSPRTLNMAGATLYTSIHEGVHASGMGTHDVDGLERNLSVMSSNGSTESFDMLPAWDRYYWTNWLPQSTITTDSLLVSDLKGKGMPEDANLKYIHQLAAGDSLGRGGTYREKYDGNWYTYSVNSTGTLFFESNYKKINNKQPINVIIDVPVLRKLNDTVSFYLIHDGAYEIEDSLKYTWYKDSVRITNNNKYSILNKELKVNGVTKNEEGFYYCVVTNKYGSKSSIAYKFFLPCNNPPKPIVIENLSVCQNAMTGSLSATATSGNKLLWYGLNQTGGKASTTSPTLSSSAIGINTYYVSQIDTISSCESPRASIIYTVKALPSKPIVNANLVVCQNATVGNFSITVSNGHKLIWYGQNEIGGTGLSSPPNFSTSIAGVSKYYMSQIDTISSCESIRTSIGLTVNAIPVKPIIKRDSLNNLFTATSGTIWFKDGMQISDTLQQIRPSSQGLYTAKTVTNGCISAFSEPYFYLVTNLIQISSDEYIQLSPNPFRDQLKINFKLNNIMKLNVELIDLSSGITMANKNDVFSGMPLNLGQINAGMYIVKISSNNQKIVQYFKVIKIK